LVFISHCYHESPRGELFLKHSVCAITEKTVKHIFKILILKFWQIF